MLRVLDILKHPHPALKRVCEPVTSFDHTLQKLALDMLYTINPPAEVQRMPWPGDTTRMGVGLGAPQVGELINLVVIAAPGFPEFAMANPVIVKAKGWKPGREGCLSLPGVHGNVLRYADVTVSYQDMSGKLCTIRAKDFQARVIQHEIDHLSGIEFTDRIDDQKICPEPLSGICPQIALLRPTQSGVSCCAS